MSPESDVTAARCTKHACCIHVAHLEAAEGLAHLTGEWHLEWMGDDSAWFLVPPQGNVVEIRVPDGAEPPGELAVDGVPFEEVRRAIQRDRLFPPC